MVDNAAAIPDRGSRKSSWAISFILAIAAVIGWYLYYAETARSDALQSSMERLGEEQVALQAALGQERKNRQQTQESLASESEALKKLRQRLAAEQGTVVQLQSELQQSQQQRQQLERESQQELSRLAAESAGLEKELQQRLAQQQSLSEQISAANADKDQLASRLQQAQDRRQQLLAQIASVNNDVEAKKGALTEAGQDIEQLTRQLDQSKQEQNRLETRVARLSEQQKQEAAHFEALRQRLERDLHESRVEITQLKNRMTVINLTSEVLFDSGSAKIKPAGRRVLDLIAESLNAYPNRAISIEGHTDNVPIGKNIPFVSNWDLSVARALAAVDYLQRRDGVAPQRLRVVGHGEFDPVASNDTAEGRQRNRRIEIRLLPEPAQGS
jgi:chemotaxis protein MotB